MRPRKTIVCVEDNEQILSVRKFFLETRGYRVVGMESAAEALRYLEGAMPGSVDLLLTDLVLPQMDGNELVRRAKEIHPGLPSLLVSGTVTNFDRAAAAATRSCRRVRVRRRRCWTGSRSWSLVSGGRRSRCSRCGPAEAVQQAAIAG